MAQLTTTIVTGSLYVTNDLQVFGSIYGNVTGTSSYATTAQSATSAGTSSAQFILTATSGLYYPAFVTASAGGTTVQTFRKANTLTFDPSTQILTATASVANNHLAGIVSSASFSGNPQISTILIGRTLPNTNYKVTVTGDDLRAWTVKSKTQTDFVINTNSNRPLDGDVYWQLTM